MILYFITRMDWVKEEEQLMKLSGNDHFVLGRRLENGTHEATIYREDGKPQKRIIAPRPSNDPDSQTFEKCPGADGVQAFHLADRSETGHRGPARANSHAFCEGWEKIQWASRARHEGGPT